MKTSVRHQAAQVIFAVLTQEHSLARVLPRYQEPLSNKDKALLQELCFGVCRYLHQMQYWVKLLMKRPLKTKDHDILALIYLGLYQLMFTRIPDHAAIGETVEVAQELNKPWAKSLLNGILRNFQRQFKQPPQEWLDDPIYFYSHPKWFVKTIQDAWPNSWQQILETNNSKPPLTLRINQQKASVPAYLEQLSAINCDAHKTEFSTVGITLVKPLDVWQLPGFADGLLSVQDEAAQLAAPLLDLVAEQRVLDACCAPGGKTSHILEQQPALASLLALDHDAIRLTRVTENLQRLNLSATLKQGDAGCPDSWWDGEPFDRILLDAPCSATGVIRRHPDIKLLRRKEDIAKLAALQLSMLKALWPTLKHGGKLLYATCSVLPEENEQVIATFLQCTSDAEHLPIDATWGESRPFGRQMLPRTLSHDGFYYASIRKN